VMTGLDHDVWDDRVHNFPRILVSHRRAGSTKDAVTRAGRAPASMWNLRLAESVGGGATDAVVVFARVQRLCAGQMIACTFSFSLQ
jgi:hypothetical protein